MTTREADARPEAEEFAATSQPIIYRDINSGEELDPNDIIMLQDPVTKRRTTFNAPKLTPQEQAAAAESLRGALESGGSQYPALTRSLLQNPERLWLLGEIQLMLSPEPNEVSYDLTADLMGGLTTTEGQRTEYEYRTAHHATQQIFWNEVGMQYGSDERDYFISAFAQLSPEGANRVGAMATAWVDTHGIDDEEKKQQLFLNISAWTAKEQQYELGQSGFFGFIDSFQEGVEREIISPLVNAGIGLISGAEEAARRQNLTVGQQIAFQMGIEPPENAGDFGWWELVSGGADAITEVGGDPLAWLAGVGAGVKATKIIPIAANASKAGRIVAAARSLLPKPFTGAAARVSGGRFARVTYSLGARTIDDLLEQTLKNGVAEDAMTLIKQANLSKFSRLYPAWSNISETAVRTIQEAVQTPDEFIEVLKADALNEVLRGGEKLDEITARAAASEEMLRGYVGAGAAEEVVDDAQTIVVRLGHKFYDDHVGRDLPGGTEIKRGKSFVEVELTRADYDELLSDAEHYVDQGAEFADKGLVASARAVTRKLKASTPPGDPMPPIERGFDELLLDQSIPHDIRLQAAKDKMAVDVLNAKTNRVFILSEVPTRSKRIFNWDNVMEIKGQGRVATGVRRTAARITPGRIPSDIDLFNTNQGVDDLRRLGEHFGLAQDSIDKMVGEFVGLELGARQEWVWDTYLRTIGRETGVPAFEHQLVQFYKGAGVRNFSASGVDLLADGKRIPMLPTQMNAKMPVPVEVLTQTFSRARSIGTRSKLAKAMGFKGRGLYSGTRSRREELMKRLRRELGDQADGMSEDQLYDMAYSLVSPNAGLDARGIWAGKMMPKAGSVFHQLHQWFTKSMLVFRPIQWMWRVALLEEPIRAHIFNLPSLYTNPLQYMARAREAHYIWNVRKWAEMNMSWGQDVLHTLTKGTKQQIVDRVTSAGLADEIWEGGKVPKTARDVRRGVEKYVENALYGRTRPNKLNPVKKVPWAVKNRAHSIATAERALKKLSLPNNFDFHESASEIAGRLVSGYLGESVGATHRKLYQWQPGMTNDEAFTHGRVWGASLIQFVEDPFGRMALRRRAAILRGNTPDITGADLVNSSRWQFMAPDLRVKYAGEADDIAVAERYMDEMLATEIDHLFKPFANELTPAKLGTLLDEFSTSRRIEGSLGGEALDWDLRSANFGGGVRQVGDFTAAMRHDTTMEIPSNLPAPTFDGRFMAEDDRGWPSRIADWTLQTFGEKATQTINRRPAWVHEYKRWYDNYRKLDVPEQHAVALATDHANRMVNHVFFNMEEAPYYVSKLNSYLPFFGATYEVVGSWSYKMPVAVGGVWPAGAGEFARKFDRLIDGLVNMGLLSRVEEEDGSTTITLNLVPPDNDTASNEEIGRALQGAGFQIVNTLDSAVATILGLEEGLGLRSQGYRLAAGHPLNPTDYGVLSFVQADIGLNPLSNIVVTALAGRIPGATGPRREAVQAGESVADIAERLGVSVDDLVRYNREIFVDLEDFGSSELYNGLLSGRVDPESLTIPANSSMNLPGSSLWDAVSDTFMPFGEISSPHEFASTFIPSAFRWVMAGMALQSQPSDTFWKDTDMTGVFAGMLPPVNEAQVASQLNEAFMYLEAHDLVNGMGPFERIQIKEQELEQLLATGQVDEANELRNEISLDTQAFLDRAQKVAAESLIMRGLTGQMLPTTPGHVRLEEQKIQEYWNTREYADSLVLGEGETRLKNFKTMEEFDEYKTQLAAWLEDPTGDRARAVFRANNPQLMAYLTPKTFYKDPVPDIQSYEEYQRQIESGEREPSPLHVTMWRARSAAIQADYYNKFIAEFGNDPNLAAATALNNRQTYQDLNQERELAYQGLEMWDDMHGGVYNQWREDNYQDVETWAQDQINDKLNTVRDNLQILFELEDNLDVEIDLEGIANLNSSIRGAIAEISGAISEYNELSGRTISRNPYEAAIHRYFQEVYIPYSESVAALYDQLPEVADSERVSLVFEQVKLLKNELAGTDVYLNGDTSTPFPNPLEYSWQGKPKEEQVIKMQQWLSRPVEWMDMDQAQRILANSPQLEGFIPQTAADFDIYRTYTLRKIEVDEAFEANEITRSQRTKAMKHLKETLHAGLIEQGRGNEIQMTMMTPYEKLEFSGLLPQQLGIFGDHVRYYKQVLEQTEETPGTVNGRRITAPLYDLVEQVFYADPAMREALQDLGINLRDETTLDTFLPYLFFGYTGER